MRRHYFFQSRMGWEMLHKFVLFVGEEGEVGFSLLMNKPLWSRRARPENNSRWLWGVDD